MTTTYQRSLLQALEAERAARSPAGSGACFDPLPLCHAGQRDAVADTAQTQAWVTTRRAGKTTGAVLLMLATATRNPDVNVLYLSTTIKRAVSTVWDELIKADREQGLGGVPNHSRHFLRLPNGSKIWVSGMETKTEADSWRGVLPRTALVFLDEGQDHKPDLLAYAYGSVILPSLADIGGRFVLAGTPGAPNGFFYDFQATVGRHSWSLFQNPHVKDAQRMLTEAMRVRGCDETDPSIRREFFGEFTTDSARQIFPVGAHNWFDKRPGGAWRYVIGFDAGTVDCAAVVVIGYTDASPALYVLESEAQPGLGSSAQVELVRSVAARYPGAVLVADPGGGGKSHIVTLRQEHWLPVEGAEKAQKAAACITLRDGLRSGRVLLARKEVELGKELGLPEWDPDAVGSVIKGHFPDRVDALLYAYRKAAALHHYSPPPPPKPTWIDQDDERILAEQEANEGILRDLGFQ